MTNKNKVRSFAPLPSLSLSFRAYIYVAKGNEWINVYTYYAYEWKNGRARYGFVTLNWIAYKCGLWRMSPNYRVTPDSLSLFTHLFPLLSVSRFTLLRKSMENRDESDNVLFFFFHTLMWFHLNIRLITVVFKSRIKQVKIRETKI